MNKLIVSLLLTLGITGVAHAAGDATAGQAKAAVCGACHGPDGNSPAPNFPKLAGQGERYLTKQMHDIIGHYNRFDLFDLRVDNRPQQPLTLRQAPGASSALPHSSLPSSALSALEDDPARTSLLQGAPESSGRADLPRK